MDHCRALEAYKHLVSHFHEKMHASAHPTLNDQDPAAQHLKLILETVPNHFVIVDGLDECEPVERKHITTLLRDLVKHCDNTWPGSLRVLILSHDLPDIRNLLCGGEITPADILSIESGHIEEDIKNYVLGMITEVKARFRLTGDQLQLVKDSTCDIKRSG